MLGKRRQWDGPWRTPLTWPDHTTPSGYWANRLTDPCMTQSPEKKRNKSWACKKRVCLDISTIYYTYMFQCVLIIFMISLKKKPAKCNFFLKKKNPSWHMNSACDSVPVTEEVGEQLAMWSSPLFHTSLHVTHTWICEIRGSFSAMSLCCPLRCQRWILVTKATPTGSDVKKSILVCRRRKCLLRFSFAHSDFFGLPTSPLMEVAQLLNVQVTNSSSIITTAYMLCI